MSDFERQMHEQDAELGEQYVAKIERDLKRRVILRAAFIILAVLEAVLMPLAFMDIINAVGWDKLALASACALIAVLYTQQIQEQRKMVLAGKATVARAKQWLEQH